MARSNAVWGIDIGQCALKAMRCKPGSSPDTIEVDKYDFIEYPKLLSQADAEPEELVREALEQFLSRNQVRGDSVAISVPGQAGLSRFFKPPPVEPGKLPDIVKYEVKQQIPFPIEDVIWDWQQLGGTVVDGRTMDAEIGLFAMKREAVYRALQPFDNAEIEVDFIQLSPLAIFNVLCHDIMQELPDPEDYDPENPPESMVVMSMGTDTTDLIISNGIKLWLRNIPIGGNHFSKQLSREMKLTHTKAEHLKRNARQAEDPQSVFRAMRPVFSDLVSEVQRSLTFFESMDKSAKISKIALLGNAAKLPGLRQFLGKQLEIDVVKVSKFDKLEGDDVKSQKAFLGNQLSFAPAYGLCLQCLKKGQMRTNLLPSEIITERIIRAKKPWVLASVSFIMLGLLLGYFFKEQAVTVVRPETTVNNVSWSDAERKSKQVGDESARKKQADDDLKSKLDQLNMLSAELTSSLRVRTPWIELLSAIQQSLPKDERLLDKEAVDPAKIPFMDRKEIYIKSVESKFFKEIETWYTTNKPIYDSQFGGQEDSGDASATDEVKEEASKAGANTDEDVKGNGWVIQIEGYHFHNSNQMIVQQKSGRTFLINNFLKSFFEEFELEAGGEKFKFEDIGVYQPTIVSNYDYEDDTIDFNSEGESLPEKIEQVNRYDFIIQMAWIPRTPAERIAAMKARKEEETKQAEAAAAAAEAAKSSDGA